VAGNAFFDRKPQLPLLLPSPSLPDPETQMDTSPQLRLLLPQLDVSLADAMLHLSSIASTVNARLTDQSFWTNDMGALSLLVPTIRQLQSLPKGPTLPPVMNLVRLAALLLLSTLKARFGLSAADLVPLRRAFIAQLKQEPPRVAAGMSALWRWRVWALLTAALQMEAGEERAPIVAALRAVLAVMGIAGAEEAAGMARPMVWIEIYDEGAMGRMNEELQGGPLG
jgi:hypothetical protein